ncbi:MAG: metallophosphatase family protein [Elusimicrobiota bacterium]|nr:metallophosphatase family protein [Elusimicrobiota bacterium]MDH5662539.1 metallophosphatase family protein [Elusimicrobiota bacterium]
MKYGIISDIHSNLEALNTILDYLKRKEKIDRFICCGDIVGYGAKANECTEIIRQLDNCCTVAGNHDWGAVGLEDTSFFNPIALAAVEWTGRHLTEDNRNYLKNLASEIEENNFLLVHGSPRDPINEYIFEERAFLANLPRIKKNICFVGHTHVPLCFYAKTSQKIEVIRLDDGTVLEINPSYKYLINCGSVGQPRDGDPRASCGIYDEKSNILRIKRINYDIAKTQKEILNAKLPTPLALRLGYGR